jgi:hypothetical protein
MGACVFGIIRPCEHRLDGELREAWRAHLCGMCLSLRDDHGQLARLATNYDGLIISVLAEAQAPSGDEASRRQAGPCPLRGMRRASVTTGEYARLAATVSLVLAAAKVRDHAADGDGPAGRPGLRRAATALARSWEAGGARAGGQLGFDTSVLTAAVARQEALEAQAGPGTSLLAITEPTETATGAAFGYTAVLAGRPGNEAALTEAGRLFGRIAHLLDAVEDLPDDTRNGAWNPLTATGADVQEARRLCADALAGIRLALADVEFTDRRLVDALLSGELRRSVRRAFGDPRPGGCATRPHAASAHAGRGPASREHAAAGQGRARPRGVPALAAAGLAATAGLIGIAGLCRVEDPYGPPIPGRRRPCGGCCRDGCCDCCCDGCCEGCGDCDGCDGCCDACDCCDCSC